MNAVNASDTYVRQDRDNNQQHCLSSVGRHRSVVTAAANDDKQTNKLIDLLRINYTTKLSISFPIAREGFNLA